MREQQTKAEYCGVIGAMHYCNHMETASTQPGGGQEDPKPRGNRNREGSLVNMTQGEQGSGGSNRNGDADPDFFEPPKKVGPEKELFPIACRDSEQESKRDLRRTL
jgi:hypothetical protein